MLRSIDVDPDLARQAVTTPDIDAPSAVEVLVDALLEAGILEGPLGVESAEDDPAARGVRVHEAREALRRKAFLWARRRLAPDPSPLERVVALVDVALEGSGAPAPIVGVVGPNLLRLRFFVTLEAALRAEIAGRVGAALPGAVVVEVMDVSMD